MFDVSARCGAAVLQCISVLLSSQTTAQCNLDKLSCCLSMSVVGLSDFGSRKEHGEELLGNIAFAS